MVNNGKQINTFNKGMNKDVAAEVYDNTHYTDARWLSPIVNEENNMGTLVNPKGTLEKFTFPSAEKIVGHTTLRDIEIFITVDSSNCTHIYRYQDDGTINVQTATQPLQDKFIEIWSDVNLDDIDKLGYTQDTKLDMVSRYENEDIQKIYFVDKDRNHPLRFFNIISNKDFNDYENFTQSNFNIIPKVELSKIEFDGYTGGKLQTGMTCYSYQQYKKYGAETSFSEVSNMIPISKTITKSNISDVYGSDLEEDCGIGIKIKIANLDSSYHRIRILAFDFKDKYSNPSVRVIFEGDTNNNELYIVDNGSSLGTYDLSVFRIFNQFFIKPKVLATKNNILFAGNIEEEYFDLDKYLANSNAYNLGLLTTDINDTDIKFYDSRIYRFNNSYSISEEECTIIEWINDTSVTFQTNQQIESITGNEILVRLVGYTSKFYTIISVTNDKHYCKISITNEVQQSNIVHLKACSYGTAKIFNSNDSYKEIKASTLNYDEIPYDYDCINKYNLVSHNTIDYQNQNSSYKYKKDNGELGGNGKNIDLSFTNISQDSGETSNDYKLNGYFDLDIQGRRSYQRDEVYRFAIQFMDNLGRKSHPKWMLDCRMPEHTDENYGNYVWNNEGVIQYSFLYPQIQVKNIPKNLDGTYMKWRVLQVKREKQDKTIVGTGLVAPTVRGQVWENHVSPLPEVNYCAVSLPSVKSLRGAYYLDMFVNGVPNYMNGEYPTDRTLMEVISPDIQFNKTDISSCIIQVVGTLDNTSTYWHRLTNDDFDPSFSWVNNYLTTSINANHVQRVKKLSRFLKLDTPLTQLRSPIEISKIASPSAFNTSTSNIKGKTYKNVCYAHEFGGVRSSHGTCTIAKIKDSEVMWLTGDEGLTSYLFAAIKRDTIPYGGNSYIARFNNKYISASSFYTNTAIHNIEYGDTYIGMFDYMRSQYNKDEDKEGINSIQEILYIPCETQINLALRNDTSFSKIADSDIKTNYKLTEDGLVDVDTGTEISKLYQYNSVYSRQNDAEIYIPLSYDSNDNYEYDTRVRRSQIKFNSEYSDSWLKFLQNDYIDLDSQYGELIDLKINKNKLLFFQPNGFGILPVGEKELLSTKDTATLALGTGGILNRFDYISDSIGISNKEALVTTPNALYMYSNKLNTLYKYDQSLVSLTDSLGMNSWFDNYVDTNKNILSGYNPIMSELLFQFPTKNNKVEVLVYNEMTNSFVYFYPHEFVDPYKFSDFITMNQFLYSFSNATGDYKGYKHNFSSSRNNIHTIQGISSLDIIVAPRKGNSVTFNVLEFLTNLTGINDEDINVTANKVLVSNNTQSTGLIDLIVGNNVKKRFETWRFAKLRDNTVGLNKPHMKGEYIKIHLEFGSESTSLLDRKLIIKNIITDFSFSNVIY